MQKKNVFVVFFAGERSRQKAGKVTQAGEYEAHGYNVNVYNILIERGVHICPRMLCYNILSSIISDQICDAFSANRYPFPDDVTRQRQMLAEVTSRLRELHTTNEAGERRREAVVNEVACGLEVWTTLVRREKATYHIMNKLSLDVTCKVR